MSKYLNYSTILLCLIINIGKAQNTVDSVAILKKQIEFLESNKNVLNSLGDRLTKMENHTLTPTGYFRTSISSSEGGETQALFHAPGAKSKYRMGNEPDTYAEFALKYEYKIDDSGKSLETLFRKSGWSAKGDNQNWKLNDIAEFYVKLNNLHKDIDVWVGRRYYDRMSTHIIDHFWLNPGQGSNMGFGLEGLRGKDKKDDIKIAFFEYETDDVKRLDGQEVNSSLDHIKSYLIDARWVDIPFNKNGKMNVWGQFSSRTSNQDLNLTSKNGFGLGFWHDQKLFEGKGSNIFYASYNYGTNVSHSGYNMRPVYENFGGDLNTVQYDLDKSHTFEFSNNFLYELDEKFAINWIVLFNQEDRGVTPYDFNTNEAIGGGRKINWFSTGFRGQKYLHKHLSLSLEVGADYVDNQVLNESGWLTKATFAPQIRWDYGYYNRPEIRPFVTYAFWGNDFVGDIGANPGSAPFVLDNNGLTFGVQLEYWW